jgi:hypothetical protein
MVLSRDEKEVEPISESSVEQFFYFLPCFPSLRSPSDEATKLSVFSFVNDTRPAAAQPLNDAVVRDGLANEWGGRPSHWWDWDAVIAVGQFRRFQWQGPLQLRVLVFGSPPDGNVGIG